MVNKILITFRQVKNTKLMAIIDGKSLANQIKAEIAQKIQYYTGKGLRAPTLAVIMVGEDPASAAYVRNKIKACKEVGIKSVDIKMIDETTEMELIAQIHSLNADKNIDGFIVQMPLPPHIDASKVIENIAPDKDVDGFHPLNLGKIMLGLPAFAPATPKGIVEMLRLMNINIAGQHVVILGRSNIVGKPLAMMLMQKRQWANATVTVCHSQTRNLKRITAQADVLIAAIGKPRFVTAEMVKSGAVVIDVGINSVPDPDRKSGYRLVGDVDFEHVKEKASWITPVPGGVGQMTVAALLQNTLQAYERNLNLL